MMKLGPALVMTPDLDVALAFYRDVLGLSLSERFETQLVSSSAGGRCTCSPARGRRRRPSTGRMGPA